MTDNTAMVRTDNHGTLHLSTVTWNINKTSLGTTEISAVQQGFTLYPNPARDVLYLKGKQNFGKNIGCVAFDASGKAMPLSFTMEENRILKIDVSKLIAGSYILSVNDGNTPLLTEKFVKD